MGGHNLCHQQRYEVCSVETLPFVQIIFSLCTICEFKKPIVAFKIRGFCKSTTMDTNYTLETDKNDYEGVIKPYFKGRMNTNIKWVSLIITITIVPS